MTSGWVKIREYASRFEAEMAQAQLQSATIPCAIHTHEGGAFGPGFQGVVPSGVELLVPGTMRAKAEEILGSPDAAG